MFPFFDDPVFRVVKEGADEVEIEPAPERKSRRALTKASHEDAVERAKHFMQKHFEQSISLQQIAAAAFLSPFHFSRVFKSLTSISPYQYLLSLRLKHAEKLLLHTPLEITDVCYQSGFTRLDYFCHVFSNHNGTSPQRYRDANSN